KEKAVEYEENNVENVETTNFLDEIFNNNSHENDFYENDFFEMNSSTSEEQLPIASTSS
ncbi:4224_t:CDS:1, partial [Diversispora eburnea]